MAFLARTPSIIVFSHSTVLLRRRPNSSGEEVPGSSCQFPAKLSRSMDKLSFCSLRIPAGLRSKPELASWNQFSPVRMRSFSDLAPFLNPMITRAIGKQQVQTDLNSEPMPKKEKSIQNLIFRIIRPFVVFGTLTGFAATVARTWIENPQLVTLSKWSLPSRTIFAFLALLAIDGYVNGINQIFDRDIDKINKGYLPIPSGDMPVSFAWLFVIICAVSSIATALAMDSQTLLLGFLVQLTLGTIYSVPPFSTKRSTYGAILTCALGRGCAFTLTLFAAAGATLGLPLQFSPATAFLAVFSTLLCAVLGTIKDVPDIEGDTKYGVATLASIYGPKRIAHLCFGFLLLIYAGATAAPVAFPQMFKSSIMIPVHILMGCRVAFQAWKLDRANYSKKEGEAFYQFMWQLLNVEYILLPLI